MHFEIASSENLPYDSSSCENMTHQFERETKDLHLFSPFTSALATQTACLENNNVSILHNSLTALS